MSNARNLANLLNSSGVLTADAGVKADNITIDGTEIDLSSGDLTLDVAGDIKLDANGQQIFFAKNGTTFGQVQTEATPANLTFESAISDGDIIFKGSDGGSGIEAMRIDMSEGGQVYIGKTSSDSGTAGNEFLASGRHLTTVNSTTCAIINRLGNEGTILLFEKDGTDMGSIGADGGQLYIGSGDVGLRFRYGSTDSVEPFHVGSLAIRDDGIDLGTSSSRFNDIHATNGSIQTSDQNEKQDIASLTAKELNVAKKLSTLFKTFRWKDRVTEKGDKARTHTGIIAQEVQSAFSAEGLDASNYGLFISSTWWEKEISVDAVKADKEKDIEAKDAYTYMDVKDEKTEGYTERTRLGVRYPELFSFIFSSIEARLTALESK